MAADQGHRRADIIKAQRKGYDGRYLQVVQQKTGARVKVLCTPELKAMLDALPRGKPDDFIIVQEGSGKPCSKDFFSREVRRTADEAGLVLLWFHDLRRTAVHSHADAGCTVPQIVAVTGHTLESATKILKRYYLPD